MVIKEKLLTLDDEGKDYYRAKDGSTIQMEFSLEIKTEVYYNKWVLRSENGRLIDFDSFRTDLMERNNYSM